MGLSENRLNPYTQWLMTVNDHYPVFKWLVHWEYTLFSDKPILECNTKEYTESMYPKRDAVP